MTQLEIGSTAPKRRDGWTHPRRGEFLRCLAATADVRHACATVGLSRQSAYRLQARDPAFAAAWDSALREERATATRALLAMLPESLRRTLSESSTLSTSRPPAAANHP